MAVVAQIDLSGYQEKDREQETNQIAERVAAAVNQLFPPKKGYRLTASTATFESPPGKRAKSWGIIVRRGPNWGYEILLTPEQAGDTVIRVKVGYYSSLSDTVGGIAGLLGVLAMIGTLVYALVSGGVKAIRAPTLLLSVVVFFVVAFVALMLGKIITLPLRRRRKNAEREAQELYATINRAVFGEAAKQQ